MCAMACAGCCTTRCLKVHWRCSRAGESRPSTRAACGPVHAPQGDVGSPSLSGLRRCDRMRSRDDIDVRASPLRLVIVYILQAIAQASANTWIDWPFTRIRGYPSDHTATSTQRLDMQAQPQTNVYERTLLARERCELAGRLSAQFFQQLRVRVTRVSSSSHKTYALTGLY